jgi:hypothetical protein
MALMCGGYCGKVLVTVDGKVTRIATYSDTCKDCITKLNRSLNEPNIPNRADNNSVYTPDFADNPDFLEIV